MMLLTEPRVVPTAAIAAITTESLPMLTFVHPLLGFPEEIEYALVSVDEGSPLSRLQGLHAESAHFLVVPAVSFFPEYAPVVGDDVVADLEIASAEDVLVLLIVHAAETLAETTVNLRAPVLVNTVNRRAAQVVLDDPSLELAASLAG